MNSRNITIGNISFVDYKHNLKCSTEDQTTLIEHISALVERSKKLTYLKKSLVGRKIEVFVFKSTSILGNAHLIWESKLLKIGVNLSAFKEDPKSYVEKILPHEISHLLCYVNYAEFNIKVRPHGKEFKQICSDIGGFAVASIRDNKLFEKTFKGEGEGEGRKPRAVYRYEYRSGCGEQIFLTKKDHEYICKGNVGTLYLKRKQKTCKIIKRDFVGRVNIREMNA